MENNGNIQNTQKFNHVIKSLYISTKLRGPIDQKKCTILKVNKGLEIWRTYSPKLIILTKDIEINTTLFVDDQILLAEEEDGL